MLVPTGEAESLAAAIFAVLGDEARRRTMGVAARTRAARLFDARDAMPKLAEILQGAAHGRALD